MYGNKSIELSLRQSVLRISVAQTPQLSADLIHLFREAGADPAVRVVVLTGAQERIFCVGGGGSAAPEDQQGRNAYWLKGMREARELILAILECDKPVIGRINGHAIGKGCSIALCCDITIMAEDAKIGDTHVKVGLAAGDGGSLLWPNLIGMMSAKRFLLTGDLLTGREAAEIGLVTEAMPRADLDARTDYWVERMVRAAPAAVAMTKRALSASIRQQAATHMDMSLGLETLTFLTEDHQEGVAALKQKRDPKFGR